MKPITSWPFVSSLCTLATAIATIVAPAPDDDEGHPLPPLTAIRVELAAYYGCTDEEIANLFMISVSCLIDRYGANLTYMRARRTHDIRKAQLDVAIKKANATMLQWLGRNDLGQTTQPQPPGEPEPNFPPKVG